MGFNSGFKELSNFQGVKIIRYHLFFRIVINRKYITQFQQIAFSF